ncbi:MAG TPA: hypothetical protein VMH39_13370, partial [Gemmatimonadaceae bacterium]|nr:hypothetical protein [Gemmatimonadaceae bacterium]
MAGVVLVTCTDGPTASRATARLTIAPQFNASASVAGGALGIDHVRVRVIQSDEDVLIDRTYAFPSTGASLSIDLTIPLSQPQDSVSILLDYLHGTEVLYSGSAGVVLQAGVTAEPVTIPVSYGGPGQKATSLTIAPRDTQLTSGDQMQFRVTALSGAVPDSVYVGWWTSNAAQPIDVNGHLAGTLTRGVVTVYAQSSTPPGLEDSTTLRIVPKPAAMVKVSGDAQTGSAGAPLSLPLVVQVNGSDQLGVSGVTVTFAAATGGGSVSASSVVTDSAGRASTTATLGSASGTQTFSASAGSLSATFSEAASGTASVKTWTGAVSTDWNTAGNWTPSAVPGTTDSVAIPSGATRQPTLHTGAYTVGGMSIQSG